MNPTESKTDPAASAVGEVAFLLETGRVADAVSLAERLVASYPDSPAAGSALRDATAARDRAGSASGTGPGRNRGRDIDPMDLESLDEEVASLHAGDRIRAESLPLEELEQSLDFEDFSIPRAPGIPPSAAEGAPEILHAPSARPIPPPVAAGPASGAASVGASRGADSSGIATLLETAEGELAAGRCDEAIAAASRAQVIEPDNARAQKVIDRAREQRDRSARELEDMLYEAQRCLERKEWSGAKNFLAEVLARRPDHEEARDLLRDVEKLLGAEEPAGRPEAPAGAPRAGGTSPDLTVGEPGASAATLPPLPGTNPPDDGLSSVPLAARAPSPRESRKESSGTGPESDSGRDRGSRRERGSSSGKSSKKSRRGMPIALKLLIGLVVVAGALGVGFYFFRQNRRAQVVAARAANPDGARKGRKAKDSAADGSAKAAAQAAATPGGAAEAKPPTDPKALFDEGRKALSAGKLEEAVASLGAAVNADPANGEAVDLLKEAQDRLAKHQQSQRDLAEAGRAFTDKRYDDSLRLFYRLPEEMQKGDVVRYQRNAWFNLAINDLMAGDCRRAIEHLDEALGLDPSDPRAAKEKKFAETYLERDKDSVYYRYAESIVPRKLEER